MRVDYDVYQKIFIASEFSYSLRTLRPISGLDQQFITRPLSRSGHDVSVFEGLSKGPATGFVQCD